MLRTSLIAIRPRRPALSCRTSPERPTSHRDNPNIFGTREYNFFFKQLQTGPHKNVIEKILFSLRKRTARVKGARSPSSQLFFAHYLFSAKRNSGGQGDAVLLISAFLSIFSLRKETAGVKGARPPCLGFSLLTIFSLRKETAGVKGARPPWSQLFFAYFLFSAKRK